MGKEATCVLRVDGRTMTGKALLETTELIFRGKDASRRWALRDLRNVEAASGELRFAHGEEAFALSIGDAAAKWAHAILHPKTRAEKIGLKAKQRVVLLGVKDAAIVSEIEGAGAKVATRMGKEPDVVLVQIDAPAGLERLAELARGIAPDGAVWTITPRGVPGLKDTDIMAEAKRAGLVDVKVVRFSDTHSANKFVIPKAKRAVKPVGRK